MKKLIRTITADRITRTATIASLVILLVILGYTLLIYRSLPPYIPLFNQLGWGDPRLAEKYLIFLPLLLAVIVMSVNTVITYLLYETMPLVSRVITITSLLISTLTLIFIIRITQLIL